MSSVNGSSHSDPFSVPPSSYRQEGENDVSESTSQKTDPQALKFTPNRYNNGAVTVGGSPGIPPKGPGQVMPDDAEPITYIQNQIVRMTGKKIEECADLEIKSSFAEVDNHDAIKAMAYRDPPHNLKAPSCYYFERIWEIKVSDKNGNPLPPLIIRKNIYTNIVIPTKHDAGLLRDRETMAGIAANTYANFVDNAIRFRTGQPTSYSKLTDDQITKVQRDNFLIMGLYSKNQQIRPNELKKALGKTITQVDLQFRAGRKEARDEESRNSSFMISLSNKVNNTSIQTIGQQHRAQKYMLVPDGDTAPAIREVAKIQKFRALEDDLAQGTDLTDALKNADIDEDAMVEHYRTENDAIEKEFADIWDLFNESSRVDIARNLFGRGMGVISDDLKAYLPEPHGRVKVNGPKTGAQRAMQLFKKSPRKEEEFGVLRRLIKAEAQVSGDLKKEADALIACYNSAYERLKELDSQLSRNEDFIDEIAGDDKEFDAMEKNREERQRVLSELEEIFGTRGSPLLLSSDNDPSVSFGTVDKSDVYSASSEEPSVKRGSISEEGEPDFAEFELPPTRRREPKVKEKADSPPPPETHRREPKGKEKADSPPQEIFDEFI